MWRIPSGYFLFDSTSPRGAVSGGKRKTWPTFFMVPGLLANYIRIRVCCVKLDGLWPSSVNLRILAGSAIQIFHDPDFRGGIRCKSRRKCSPHASCLWGKVLRGIPDRWMSIFNKGLDSDQHYVHSVRSYSPMTFLYWRPRGVQPHMTSAIVGGSPKRGWQSLIFSIF